MEMKVMVSCSALKLLVGVSLLYGFNSCKFKTDDTLQNEREVGKSIQLDDSTICQAERYADLELASWPPTNMVAVEYDEVTMFSVDKQHYAKKSLPRLRKGERKQEVSLGFAILDSLGQPAYQHIRSWKLQKSEMEELRSIFYLPQNNGMIEGRLCIGYFRDAFVFYRQQQKVAQVQVCFECQQIDIPNDTSNLADRFTTDGDWKRLQHFVNSMKQIH